MTETSKDRLLRRIRALLAKTVENGCTEGEAMAAAEKAARMMAEHELSMSDLEREEMRYEARSRPVYDEVGWQLWRVAQAIDKLTHTKSYTDAFGIQANSISFFGREDDVEIAGYLLDIVENALRAGLSHYEGMIAYYVPVIRRRKRLAYLDGMVDSMSKNIEKIAWIRSHETVGGKEIIVSKAGALQDAMKMANLSLVSNSPSRGAYDFDAFYDLGRIDGDKVSFNAGLDANAPAGLIEGDKN